MGAIKCHKNRRPTDAEVFKLLLDVVDGGKWVETMAFFAENSMPKRSKWQAMANIVVANVNLLLFYFIRWSSYFYLVFLYANL